MLHQIFFSQNEYFFRALNVQHFSKWFNPWCKWYVFNRTYYAWDKWTEQYTHSKTFRLHMMQMNGQNGPVADVTVAVYAWQNLCWTLHILHWLVSAIIIIYHLFGLHCTLFKHNENSLQKYRRPVNILLASFHSLSRSLAWDQQSSMLCAALFPQARGIGGFGSDLAMRSVDSMRHNGQRLPSARRLCLADFCLANMSDGGWRAKLLLRYSHRSTPLLSPLNHEYIVLFDAVFCAWRRKNIKHT